MKDIKRGPALYVAVLMLIGIAFLLRSILSYMAGNNLPPWITFYPTVMLIALIGGLRAGLLATAAATLSAYYFLFPPQGFVFKGLATSMSTALFVGMGVFMSAVADRYLRITGSLEELVTERTAEVVSVNKALEKEIAAHRQAQEALHRAYEDLELKVQERTKEVGEANATVKAERQRLYNVLEALPAMICLLTPDYHVAFANKSFRDRFGESHGRHCYDYCFGKDQPCDFCETYDVLKTGKPHYWEVEGSDGSVIAAYDFPFTDTDGSPLILEMDIDITKQRTTERELKELADTLEGRIKERTADLQIANETLRESRVAALNLMEDAVSARNLAEAASDEVRRESEIRKEAEESLRAHLEELTRLNNAMVGRELRMIELKNEVNNLCGKAGAPPRYKVVFEGEQT